MKSQTEGYNKPGFYKIFAPCINGKRKKEQIYIFVAQNNQ